MSTPSILSIRGKAIRGGLVLVLLVVCGLLSFHFWPKEEPPSTNVPLGVEQAAIVTYSGPLIAVAPYKWGAAVNVRIAGLTEQPKSRIYDLRYIANRGGTFDLKDYLVAADGSALGGLPSFKIHGDPKLSKEIETRIQETEMMRVEVGGHYYATMVVLGIVWVLWLLMLIFYKRSKPASEAVDAAPEPTLRDLLGAALHRLQTVGLTAAEKAKLEMLLLRRWREELDLADQPMSAALERINRSETRGDELRRIQHWLHHPFSPVQQEEVANVLAAAIEQPPSRAPVSA